MANILGRRKREGGLCSELQEWKWVRWRAKRSPLVWATVCSALQLRSVNTDQARCEGILQQVLSVTHPVCLCDHCLRSGCFISHTRTCTHACTPPPVLPKGTWRWGVPLPKSDRCSNRKSKNQRPIIPIICSDMELMSGFLEVTDIWSSLIIQWNSIHLGSFLFSLYYFYYYYCQVFLDNFSQMGVTVFQTRLGGLQPCNTCCEICLQCTKQS